MANNGYLLQSGVCSPSVFERAYLACSSKYSGVGNVGLFIQPDFSSIRGGSAYCYSSSLGNIGSPVPISLSPDCVLSGPSLTETEQIQAINQFLPYALAFLAAIWGGKKVFDLLWGTAFRPRRVSDPE